MTLEVLQLVLVDNGKHVEAKDLPPSTPLEQIKLGKNEKAFLIEYDTEDSLRKEVRISNLIAWNFRSNVSFVTVQTPLKKTC